MKSRKTAGIIAGALLALCSLTLSFPASASAHIKCDMCYTADYTSVTLTPDSKGNTIHYTTDGSDPDTSSPVYTKKLGFRKAATLKAAEFDESGKMVGKVKTIEVQRVLSKPKFHVKDKFDGTVVVEIISEKKGAAIHFTTNGKDPSESSKALDGKLIRVKKDCEIKAIAVMDGWKTSSVASIKPLDLVTGDSYNDYIQQCLELTNAERAKKGLDPLKLNKDLCSAALLRAKELSSNYDNGHTRPNGKRWVTTLAEFGYIHRYASENYGKLDRSGVNPEQIIDIWMHSDNHRAAILNEMGTEIGIGFYQADGYCYWIQLFGEKM